MSGGIPKVVVFQAINFFGLLGILFFMLRGKVKNYFQQRHKVLTHSITEAQRLKADAEKKHQEYSLKIQSLEHDSATMLEKIKQEGEEQKKKILDEAKRLAQSIEVEAQRTVANEIEKARAELYNEALQLSLNGARQILTKSVADNDQRRLQKEFVEKIEAVQ